MGRRAKSNFGRKPGYFEKLAMGTAHDTYDPAKEGYGSEAEWCSIFNVRMGFEEAKSYKASSKRKWGSDWTVLGELAGVHIDENSPWTDIKSAFRKASMNCHPDRMTQHGKSTIVDSYVNGQGQTVTVTQAEEEFKTVSAAFAMLEDIYRSKGRLN